MAAELLVALPALDDVLAGRLAAPPALQRLLDLGRIGIGGGDAAMAEVLGVGKLPAAGPRAALAAGDAAVPGATWLRVDPVYLQPDLTAVWLRRPAALDWAAESMRPLHEALAELFDRPGLTWFPPSRSMPGRLAVEDPDEASPGTRFTPLPDALGRRLDEILPRGRDAARWHALINESQMVFHQFRALDDPGTPGLGLWLWGVGGLQEAPRERKVSQVVAAGDRASGEGLARWLDLPPGAVDDWRPADGRTMVDATFLDDVPGRLADLDRELLDPVVAALRTGRLRTLRLIGVARQVSANRWSRYAFWRRAFRPEEPA